jgi:hypothetical protein
MFTCVRIYVEVDLENIISKAINLTLDGWSHLQPLDYEQIPFKYNYYHEYGHFLKDCKSKIYTQPPLKMATCPETNGRS